MSISNTTVKASYQGNGSNDTFAIPFDPIVADSAETLVYIRDESVDPPTETLQVEGALQDYTLTGALTADDFNTSVVFNTPPAATDVVVVVRVMPLTQTLNLTSASFNPRSVNKAFDRVVAMIQQLNERINRAPVLAVSEQISPLVLPEPDAGALLQWNDAGTQITNSQTQASVLIDFDTYVSAAEAAAADAEAAAATATAAAAAAAASSTLASDHIADTDDAHDASAISFDPSGTSYIETDLQALLEEVDNDIQAIDSFSQGVDAALTSHMSDTSTHGVGEIVGTTETQALTNKDIDGGTATNSSRITIPGAAKATLDGLTRKAGTIVYGTDTKLFYLDDGVSLIAVGSGAGGGGGSILWEEVGGNSPVKLINSNYLAAYLFEATMAQELYTEIHVPSSYVAGSPIALKVKAYSSDTSGNFLLSAQATLIRAENDDVASTTNQRTTTNSAITMSSSNDDEIQKISLDLTDGSGQINGVAVSPEDTILVRLYRYASDTATGVVRLLYKQTEVTFT